MKRLIEYIMRWLGHGPQDDYLDDSEDYDKGTILNYIKPGRECGKKE